MRVLRNLSKLPKPNQNKMKLLSLTYKITPEKEGGFSVFCLDWKSINTQGETIADCKKNAIEATELMIEVYKDGKLDKTAYPKIRNHAANPYNFQLTFDIETAKHIRLASIQKKAHLHPLRNIVAFL